MASFVRKDFILCETVAGVLQTISERYGIDSCWLLWQFERYVLTGGATPLCITTANYPRNIKDGVHRVNFEINYDNDNPNLVKFIRFDELPRKCKYIVTQTSMKHLKDDADCKCPLWIEIPKAAEREGITGARSLLNAEICCSDWKNYLTPSPETEIERTHLTLAQDNVLWLQTQIAFKDTMNGRLHSSLASSIAEISALKAEILNLRVVEIAKTQVLKEKIDVLQAEIKAETKAKDTAVDELDGKMKSLKTNIEKLQANLKVKTDTITKLRRDLRAKGNMEEDSGSDTPTPATTKKRKVAALQTPRAKSQTNTKTPKTAPVMYGRSSTLDSATSSQNEVISPSRTMVTTRTPLPSLARLQDATMNLRDAFELGRTRSATRAPLFLDNTPTAYTNSKLSPVTISSSSEPDEKVFN